MSLEIRTRHTSAFIQRAVSLILDSFLSTQRTAGQRVTEAQRVSWPGARLGTDPTTIPSPRIDDDIDDYKK